MPLEQRFSGAGIYALFYVGEDPDYAPERTLDATHPIYGGKAVPSGARKGVLEKQIVGTNLYDRLAEHTASIEAATDLATGDFLARYLVVEPLWIVMAEKLTILDRDFGGNLIVYGGVVQSVDYQGNSANLFASFTYVKSDVFTLGLLSNYGSASSGHPEIYANDPVTIQGGRVYDVNIGAWTTPDAYKGNVYNPASMERYQWNGNNQVASRDPSGYDNIFDGQGVGGQPGPADQGANGPPVIATTDTNDSLFGSLMVTLAFGTNRMASETRDDYQYSIFPLLFKPSLGGPGDPASASDFKRATAFMNEEVYKTGTITTINGTYVEYTLLWEVILNLGWSTMERLEFGLNQGIVTHKHFEPDEGAPRPAVEIPEEVMVDPLPVVP